MFFYSIEITSYFTKKNHGHKLRPGAGARPERHLALCLSGPSCLRGAAPGALELALGNFRGRSLKETMGKRGLNQKKWGFHQEINWVTGFNEEKCDLTKKNGGLTNKHCDMTIKNGKLPPNRGREFSNVRISNDVNQQKDVCLTKQVRMKPPATNSEEFQNAKMMYCRTRTKISPCKIRHFTHKNKQGCKPTKSWCWLNCGTGQNVCWRRQEIDWPSFI